MDSTWVALLRGVNVGGSRKLPMKALRAALGEEGFSAVATYIQSGNVVFRAPGEAAEVQARVVDAIRRSFDLDVEVMIRGAGEMAHVAESNPLAAGGRVDAKLHVAFLADTPSRPLVEALRARPPGGEELRVAGREVFLHYPDGLGRSGLGHAWLERALGVAVTMRNWRTVRKLAEMARALEAPL